MEGSNDRCSSVTGLSTHASLVALRETPRARGERHLSRLWVMPPFGLAQVTGSNGRFVAVSVSTATLTVSTGSHAQRTKANLG